MGLSSAHHEVCLSETVFFKLQKKKIVFPAASAFPPPPQITLPFSSHLFFWLLFEVHQ